MTSKERLREYIEKDALYQEYLAGDTKDLTDFDKFCIQHCKDIEELLKENEDLKKQLEETDRKLFLTKNELDMRQKCIDNKLIQQKDFIKWLEDYLKLFDNMDIEEQASYDTIEEILQKYKEIVNGDDK